MTTMPPALVDAAWLEHNLDAVVVLDCRWSLADPTAGRRAYEEGHIPGALYASLDGDLSDMSVNDAGRHPLPTKDEFVRTLERLGVGDHDDVVVYDDMDGAIASRAWWLLRWVGHETVSVLDGGFPAWVAGSSAVEAGWIEPVPATHTIGDTSMPVVDRHGVASRSEGTLLLDARSADRFRGDVEPLDPAAGHIPGAQNAPYAGNLAGGSLRPPEELANRFEVLGVRANTKAIVYCGSGVTACHDILAMEVAGLGTATLYPGSWSDWSAAGGDVATGD